MSLNLLKYLIALALLITLQHPARAFPQDDSTVIDKDTVIAVANTIVKLGEAFPDSLWPGDELNQMPVILYVPDQWAILLNAPDRANGFGECPSDWPRMRGSVQYHDGNLGDLVGQLAFNVSIESLSVAAVPFSGQDSRTYFEYAVHENFHQYQDGHFGDIQWGREELYPIEDVENSSLACLEMLVLSDCVNQLVQRNSASAEECMSLFLAVRHERWGRADSSLTQYEQGQELKEGTAEYVQTKALSLIPLLAPVPETSGSIGYLDLQPTEADMPSNILEGLNTMTSGGFIAPEDMPRNRIYPVGATQGYILDRLGVDWQPIAQQGGPDFTYAGLMAKELKYDTSQTDSLVARAKLMFNYRTINTASKRAIDSYRIGFDSALAAFESQPGIRVELNFNSKNLVRSRSSSAKKWLADNGTQEFRDHYDIYVQRNLTEQDIPAEYRGTGLFDLTGGEFFFKLSNAGLLEKTDWATKDKTLVLYCPGIELLSVDGKSKDAAVPAHYRFERLNIIGQNFEFRTARSGELRISPEGVSISVSP